MEEKSNLLDEFAPQKGEYQEYRESYAMLRSLAIIAFTIAVILYGVVFIPYKWDARGIGYIVGAIIGFSLFIILPSVVSGLLLAFFIDRKHPYKDRFNKSFWIFMLGLSLLVAVSFGLAALNQESTLVP